MTVPRLLTTTVHDETYGGVIYHIEGELVPVLQVELSTMPVYFEHHILLWKDPSVGIEVKSLKGGFKRVLAGVPIVMTQAHGPGRIAFSRDGAGQVFALHLRQGEQIDVREHQFLAATGEVEYGYTRVKGAANIMLSGTGFFIDTFQCPMADGVLWLHGYGNVFEVNLESGEQIDIEPGGWIYKDSTVKMDTQFQSLKTGLFASSASIVWNRFTGPGRLALQSMYIHLPTEG